MERQQPPPCSYIPYLDLICAPGRSGEEAASVWTKLTGTGRASASRINESCLASRSDVPKGNVGAVFVPGNRQQRAAIGSKREIPDHPGGSEAHAPESDASVRWQWVAVRVAVGERLVSGSVRLGSGLGRLGFVAGWLGGELRAGK